MNFLYNTCNVIGKSLYFLYESSLKISVRAYLLSFYNMNDEAITHIENTSVIACNNYFKDISMNISWKCIELMTLINAYYKKTIRPQFHKLTNNYFKKSVIVIKNNIESCSFKDWKDLYDCVNKNNNIVDYDIILYINYDNEESKKNYTYISESILDSNPKNKFEKKSDVQFIIFQLTYKDNNYDINLKDPKNYIIENNIFKPVFFKYYMKKIYNIDLIGDYSINYMTNDMNVTKLNSPFYIKLSNTGLTSFPMKREPLEIIREEHTDNSHNNSDNDSDNDSNNDSASDSESDKLIQEIMLHEMLKEHYD